MNVGKPSPTLEERNLSLYNDYKFAPAEFGLVNRLAKKYGVSRQRVMQIVKREQLKDEVLPLVGNDQKN
jgi:Mor family transcriptional regulator